MNKKIIQMYSKSLLLFICLCLGQLIVESSQIQSGDNLIQLIENFSCDQEDLYHSYMIPMSGMVSERMERFYQDWQNRLSQIDFSTLTVDGRIDYFLFKNYLNYSHQQLILKKKTELEIKELLPFWKIITGLEENRRRMEKLNYADAAEKMNEISQEILKVQGNINDKTKKTPLAKPTIANAIDMFAKLERSLNRWYGFYNGYDPLFDWWLEKPYQKAKESLSQYNDFLKKLLKALIDEEKKESIPGKPAGREVLLADLNYACIPYTPEELIAEGEKQYQWCLEEMKKAAQEMGHKDNWLKALDEVKNRYVTPGEQPQLIKNQAIEAIEFLEKNNLITIPDLAKETYRIEMMSPEQQKVNPFFTGGDIISVSYPTKIMTHEEKLMSLRGNNPHFTRAVVHHELIAGHHLQGFMSKRYKPYRQIFDTPFNLEGWPLHWEMLLWNLHFAQSPEDKIGMLFWRMHRAARIIFSLKFHLGQMTIQECVDFLVQAVGHERANAEGEVRRSFAGYYEPLYQCAYLVGGLQIRALYHELVDGGKMTAKQFHDAVMRENGIPIELLRAKLTGQVLNKNFKTSWKFLKMD